MTSGPRALAALPLALMLSQACTYASAGSRRPPSATRVAAAAALSSADGAGVQRDAALAMARAAPRLAAVWPGPWGPNAGVLLVADTGAALVTTMPAPAGFGPAPWPADVPGPGAARVYWRPGALAGVPRLELDYPLGGRRVTAGGVQSTVAGTLEFLLHESFHTYQHARFDRRGDVREYLPDSLTAAPDYAARAEPERRLLAVALAELEPGRLRRAAAEYLAARRTRLGTVPPEAAAVERQVERYEGSAHFVGYAAAVTALGLPAAAAADSVRAALTAPLPAPRPWMPRYFATVRFRAYGTGAGMALLLERLGARDWRAQLERGAFFDDLLSTAIAGPGQPDPRPPGA